MSVKITILFLYLIFIAYREIKQYKCNHEYDYKILTDGYYDYYGGICRKCGRETY